MDGLKGAFDSFRVEEAYNWRDDIMEITRLIIHETDEARLNNIAEHFEVDLSEIRDFLEMKRKKTQKPRTNYDLLIRLSPEELAKLLAIIPNCGKPATYTTGGFCIDDGIRTEKEWLDWLKQEVEDGRN